MLWVFLPHSTRVYHNLQTLIVYWIYSSYEYSYFFIKKKKNSLVDIESYIKEFLLMFLHDFALSSCIFLYVIISYVYVFLVPYMF
jgi:hypothetical protein